MKPIVITGGAGFIGTNLAHRLLSHGQPVVVYDNLSRPGVERNLRWLTATHGSQVRVEIADVRDGAALGRVLTRASAVFHLAAQTAVTTSLTDPDRDFDVNARGTLNLLEVLRTCPKPPMLLYTSTNKVYGDLNDVGLQVVGSQYTPVDAALLRDGISEARPLDFHTPYGCSKGTADQYVLEYARSYGLPACVFRMSCIYGPHQLGTEDQGWVAHFVRSALESRAIRIYGDGMQVRDLLFVEDLVDAMLLAREHIERCAGQAFNIGGGTARAASLLDVLEQLRRVHGNCDVHFDAWRPSDQRYYVSNTQKYQLATGWAPRVSVERGIAQLYAWAAEDRTRARRASARSAAPESARNQAS
ncbi:MAG TPA: NAD-dependent epimerase/dehydratase family protein [Polyangiales bacterium]|nr:NAD-dependent epimerase/dehydratase family protein [Polyangiales bacterium]